MKRKLALILSALLLFVLLPQAAMAEVTISGTATAGGTLSVTLNDPDDTVQWYFGETEDGAFEKVAKATEATLAVPRTLIGYYLKAGITPVGSEEETLSAPVKVRGEINEIANLSFDNETDLSAFTLSTDVTASVADGVAKFKGEISSVNIAAKAGAFQGTIAPDVFVAEARVKYDVTNGKKGGIRIIVADKERYKYCVMYSTNPDSDSITRKFIYKTQQTDSGNNGPLVNTRIGNKNGQYATLRVMTDLTANRMYVDFDGAIHEFDCSGTEKYNNQTMYSLAEGLKYNIEIVGGETYVDYIRFYGLNDVTDVSAQKLKLRGTAAVGRSLRMDYTYNSISGKAEGTPAYKWYMADTAAGPFTDANVIAGATSSTLPLGIRQSGKWVKGVVIPNAADGTVGRGAETKAVYVTPATEEVVTYDYNYTNLTGDALTAALAQDFTLNDLNNKLTQVDLGDGNYAVTVTDASGASLSRTTKVATGKDYAIDSTADIIVLELRACYLKTGTGGGVGFDFGTSAGYGDSNFLYLNQADGLSGAAANGQLYLNQNTSSQRTAVAPVPYGSAPGKYIKIEYVIDRAQGIVDVYVDDVYKDNWRIGTYSSNSITSAPLAATDLKMKLDKGGYKCRVRLCGSGAVDYVKVRTYKTQGSLPTLDVMSSAYVMESAETNTLTVGEMGGRIRAINYSTASQGITIVMAAYEGNCISDIVVETVQVPAMCGWQDVDLTQTLTVTADTTRTAIFAWDGMGTMHPLIDANNLYKST